jgi:hypothetical protein
MHLQEGDQRWQLLPIAGQRTVWEHTRRPDRPCREQSGQGTVSVGPSGLARKSKCSLKQWVGDPDAALPSLAFADAAASAELTNGLSCGSGCPDQLPVCDRNNMCGPCIQDSQCKSGKFCDVTFGQCVDLSNAKYGGGCSTQGRPTTIPGTSGGALGLFGFLLAGFFWSRAVARGAGRRAASSPLASRSWR